MKYYVNYSCGHNGVVDLFGSYADRKRKMDYFEKYELCPDCYQDKKTQKEQKIKGGKNEFKN